MNSATGPIAVFADRDADVWGVILGGDQPRAAVSRLTDADAAALQVAALDLEDDEVWVLTATGCALRIECADADSATAEPGDELEPCRVSGSVTIDGLEREVDVGGVRSAAVALDGLDSVRLFGAWFPGGHELALLSARPRGAKGQDRDTIAVVARGEDHALVSDPRLSTTYDVGGVPRRVGIELWLGDDEDGDQWPRRVAGTATGSQMDSSGISAYAFECASRGETGAGAYVLLRG